MKKFKKSLKIIFSLVAVIFIALILSCFTYYHIVTFSANLDTESLEATKQASIELYDINNKPLSLTKNNYIPIDSLSNQTKNAFICAEDKRFYSHHGIDYVRIAGAVVSNIKSGSFSQGASTISQQLIKNTQLSNEKTITRKLKEIKITKSLEKNYSKDEILELYLNNIYFGDGCYGIENASLHYFSKSSKDLTLEEGALLAGIINAPSVYNPQTNPDRALSRRNLILGLMQKYGKISSAECESAQSTPINLNITSLTNNNILYNGILEEVCSVLSVRENELKNKKLKIYTYLDGDLQQELSSNIAERYSGLESDPNVACVVADNSTGGIVAMAGNIKSLITKHQPGSVIKPILVYAPAIEDNIISPATLILDEKINISGYSPENADGNYHGMVSAKEALANSYNVPAVKLLNEIGVSDAQKFASNLGIAFADTDNNLAIALGGMTNGVEPIKICEAYTAFACSGEYKQYRFIKCIKTDKKELYSASVSSKKVMKDSTAFLVTDMLKSATKTGTAKRLKDLGYDIAAKTGTVGLDSSTKNSDAYNVAYTSRHTILSYCGGSIMPETINGATYPTILTKEICTKLYSTNKPQDFAVPASVCTKQIDKQDYKNGKLTLTSADGIEAYFSKNNLPKPKIENFSPHLEVFNFEGKKPLISFTTNENYTFKVIRISEKNAETILNSNETKNEKLIKFEDKTAKNNEIYEYFVEFCEKSTNEVTTSNKVKLKTF